jgi:hypothetical protein
MSEEIKIMDTEFEKDKRILELIQEIIHGGSK